MKDHGTLTIRLEYDKLYIRKIHLWIPGLKFEKDGLLDTNRYEKIPLGRHRAVLTLYLANGKTVKQDIQLNMHSDKENIHVFNLYDIPNQVFIRPVNSKEKIVLATEVKIEGIDSTFRPVRDENGVSYSLRAGKYEAKVVMPNMEVKSFPLVIKEDERVYLLPVEDKEEFRHDPRVEMTLPAAYMTEEGEWHSSKSINISASGVCLIREPKSKKSNKVYVRLLIPGSDKFVECYANVRWDKEGHSSNSLMGLELLVDEASRNELSKGIASMASMQSHSHNFIRK